MSSHSAQKTLVFSTKEVEKSVTMEDAIRVVEQSFVEHGNNRASNLTTGIETKEKDVHIKVGYLESVKYVALKTSGLIVLSATNVRTPLAIMDSSLITWLRTGAAGAVASKYLARRNSKKVAIIGTGKQGRAQLIGLTKIFSEITSVRAWSPTATKRETYASEMSRKLDIDVSAAESVKEAIVNADLIATVTWSREPLVLGEWVIPGTHINAIGADLPGMQELDSALFLKSRIFVDELEQAQKMGAMNVAFASGRLGRKNISGTLGDVVSGKIPGRTAAEDITIFDSSGLGMQDVALAALIYERRETIGHEEILIS